MEEAWLSELEMTRSEKQILSHNFDDQEQYHQQNEHDMDTLNEELAAVLGEDFSFTDFNAENTTISSLLNSSTQTPNNLSDQSTISDQQLPTPSDNIVLIDDHDDHDYYQQVLQDHPRTVKKGCKGSSISGEEVAAKTSGKRKRRDPEKVRGHIMAERKRRELLTQRFIALSAMIPDLKKIDKTTIIEAAIKHLGQVQERVKVLEEAAISKNNNEGSVISKRTQLVINKDDDNAIKNGSSSICSLGGSDDDDDGHQRDKLPDIEVKVTRKTLLLKICCARRKGILAKIYQQAENRNMTILNSNVVTFERSTFDITIIARMEVAEGYDKQVRDLVTTLHSVL